ncbi:hypothetical protein SELMODRAFT_432256 [Selaginella moellendorffii]|uniref:Uncharacterized protein n=1 Tax=Selaginella moellendorffii TaxID=88036 RepID=D8TFG1_SELML|nr:hypothetical protein SELMODRAFT_432256 [Selaginella moellendorffii]
MGTNEKLTKLDRLLLREVDGQIGQHRGHEVSGLAHFECSGCYFPRKARRMKHARGSAYVAMYAMLGSALLAQMQLGAVDGMLLELMSLLRSLENQVAGMCLAGLLAVPIAEHRVLGCVLARCFLHSVYCC